MTSKKSENEICKGKSSPQSSTSYSTTCEPVSVSVPESISETNEIEKEISLHKFLDLMKVSCHINNVIAVQNNEKSWHIRNQTEYYTHSNTNNLEEDNLRLQKLMDNELLRDILGPKLQHSTLLNNTESGMPSTSTAAIAHTISSYTSRTVKKADCKFARCEKVQSKLYKKLDYVINEGMMDSVLSFICPIPMPTTLANLKSKQKKQVMMPKPSNTPQEMSNSNKSLNCNSKNAAETDKDIAKSRSIELISDDVRITRKPVTARKERTEPEVIIHVCDEVKNTTRDFHCSQKLLVEKMGYFAEITAGQKLEEMDISVHCDIQIFEWLIKWMKLTDLVESSGGRNAICHDAESVPHLDANNVVPLLVSAGFLQMEPLIIDCLSFCHARLSEVVRASTNLSCLNDPIITRLAAMFTNLELEMVNDKKERLTPRLWIKLIQSLFEPEPEALRGHFYSLAGLFRCAKCGEYLTNTTKSYVACQPSNNRLTRWGQLSSNHVRNNLWNINNFIVQLFKERRSWRGVYWKLWSLCHYLYCCVCEIHIPVYKMTWCRFHPLSPNYMESTQEDSIPGPLGRYPCCGQRAFRFETFPDNNGCHFREHSILAETDRERQLLHITQVVMDDCIFSEPPAVDIVTEGAPSWSKLPLTPQECREGLLPNISEGEIKSKIIRKCQGDTFFDDDDSYSDSESGSDSIKKMELSRKSNDYRLFDFSSDGCESEKGDMPVFRTKKPKKKKYNEIHLINTNCGRYWFGELSARSNQDHQREYEEKTIKHIAQQINKNNGLEQSLLPNIPIGGIYVRLESEWKEQLKQKSSLINVNSSSGTGISAVAKPKLKG